jgi:hypothetical protein
LASRWTANSSRRRPSLGDGRQPAAPRGRLTGDRPDRLHHRRSRRRRIDRTTPTPPPLAAQTVSRSDSPGTLASQLGAADPRFDSSSDAVLVEAPGPSTHAWGLGPSPSGYQSP